eukprot:4559005-Pleurochrysis_carterae.AAC.1
MKAAEAKKKALREQLRAKQAPQVHNWDKLTDGGKRWARKTDVDFLEAVFFEREWRAEDLARALEKTDYLKLLFNTSQLWPLRIQWLRGVIESMLANHWSAELTASIVVAMNVSTRNCDEMRNLTGKKYNLELDRHERIVLASHPFPHHQHEVVYLQSPIRPRNQWVPELAKMRAQLGTEVLADGKTASKRLAAEVKVMFHRDHHRMSAGIGCTEESPMHVHFSANGFPVTGFSLLHACVSNVSLLPRFLSHSEAELSCLLVSRQAESNSALSAVFMESAITADWNQIRRDGGILLHGAAGSTAGTNSSTAAADSLTAADSWTAAD